MFCKYCGTQVPDDAAFCQKCGTKLITSDTVQQISNVPVAKIKQDPAVDMDFKKFVDNRVKETTKFQSAEDLLNNSKPMTPLWICFGVVVLFFTVLGLIQGMPAGILLGLIFGYSAAYIAGGIIRSRFRHKFFRVVDGSIDTDDLVRFLSENLNYLQPYFHEWGYMTQGGFVLGTIEAALSKAIKEVIICAPFGMKQKRLTDICIRPDPTNPDSGQTQIIFGAENNGVTFLRLDTRFPMHICLLKTVPITSAAVEYYLKSKELA